jgi:hypothetical protein
MTNVVPFKAMRDAPKAVRSQMETKIISVDEVKSWGAPKFQRPIQVNAKVMAAAEEMKSNGCEISGVITLGYVGKNEHLLVIDGQHRLKGFLISGLPEIIADLRVCHFETMFEAAQEFYRLNSSLVKMRPDDLLRALEPGSPALAAIRKHCNFVGYGQVRRGGSSQAVLSMSAVIRCWLSSSSDTPGSSVAGKSAVTIAEQTDIISAEQCVVFLLCCHSAWGNDPEYYRLWGNLNLTICMWLWRRLVLDKERGVKRYVLLAPDQFKRCLMSVSASSSYIDWLQGRGMSDRDRSPTYNKLKAIFTQRLLEDTKRSRKEIKLPTPAWASS